jgi:hypothetical protein
MHVATEIADSPGHDVDLKTAVSSLPAYGDDVWLKSPDINGAALLHLLICHGGYVRYRMEYICAELYVYGTRFTNTSDSLNDLHQPPVELLQPMLSARLC